MSSAHVEHGQTASAQHETPHTTRSVEGAGRELRAYLVAPGGRSMRATEG
jgi:hypothetical protein